MVVVAVGDNSQKGKISKLLESPNEDTPLTKKLEHLSNRILTGMFFELFLLFFRNWKIWTCSCNFNFGGTDHQICCSIQ